MKDPVITTAKKARRVIRRNTLAALVMLFTCISLFVFARLSSVMQDNHWTKAILATSSPTITPTPGWWTRVYTPTPQTAASTATAKSSSPVFRAGITFTPVPNNPRHKKP